MNKNGLNFNLLISLIEQTHKQFQQQAIKAVNIALTIRNWLVGYYIVEFEQKGEDRAEYGSKLLHDKVQPVNMLAIHQQLGDGMGLC